MTLVRPLQPSKALLPIVVTEGGTVYELNPETGRKLVRGEQLQIRQEDLTMVQAGRREQWRPESQKRRRSCGNCGYETEEDFSYCPKCGGRLEERQ